jgi:antitoxin HicB
MRKEGGCVRMGPMKANTRTYTLSIEKHPDGHLACFPALAGCHTWGRTYEDAIALAEEALALYLETLAANGDPIPEEHSDKPVSLGVTVRTPVIA